MDIWILDILTDWGLTVSVAQFIVTVLICVGVWRR